MLKILPGTINANNDLLYLEVTGLKLVKHISNIAYLQIRDYICCFFLVEVRVLTIGPNVSVKEIPLIRTEQANMDIDLFEIAKNNPSSM